LQGSRIIALSDKFLLLLHEGEVMHGETRKLIDIIIEKRAAGNPAIEMTTKAKLILKGINVDSFSSTSSDDPAMIQKVKQAAAELGVVLNEPSY